MVKKDKLKEMYGKDYQTALKFANEIYSEFSSIIKSIIYFGSSNRQETSGDIDILVLFNDSQVLTDNGFKIYFNKKINEAKIKISNRLHLNIVTLTVFFQNLIHGEPIVLNILREGIPIIDTGFFSPLKILLQEGKLKPTPEAIFNSATRVDMHLKRSKLDLLSSFQELYLSMIDSAQATMMAYGIVAPSPKKIPELLKTIKASKTIISYFKEIQKLAKKIEHRENIKIDGKKYDECYKKTTTFNKDMEKKLQKKI